MVPSTRLLKTASSLSSTRLCLEDWAKPYLAISPHWENNYNSCNTRLSPTRGRKDQEVEVETSDKTIFPASKEIDDSSTLPALSLLPILSN